MYCTRADIEKKRIAREHLLDLTDDERTGEFDDSAGAVPPQENTLPLYSDATSLINERVLESIEDADNEIDTYLRGIYALPITVEIPAILNTLSVNISLYNLYIRRGNSMPDTIKLLYENSLAMLKRFAERKLTLDLPKNDNPETETQSAFAVHTAPKIFDKIAYS